MAVRNIKISGKTFFFVADDLGMPVSFGYETERQANEVAALIESSEGMAAIPEGIDVEAAIKQKVNVYVVRSHEKQSIPDGRELCFTGTAFEVDRFYNDLTHAQRVNDLYLFGENPDDAVAYLNWEHAGCGALGR